jgi:hypothetical protein
LYKIQSFFGGAGNINITANRQEAIFTVSRLDDIVNIIIPHFKSYPLQSAKKVDFGLWAQCVELMQNKEHLTESGLKTIVSLKSVLNLGLTEKLKLNFSDTKVTVRPEYVVNDALDPNWVSGFSEGDSSFYVSISDKGIVRIFYQIGLHNRETPLLHVLQDFFGGVGKIYVQLTRDSV